MLPVLAAMNGTCLATAPEMLTRQQSPASLLLTLALLLLTTAFLFFPQRQRCATRRALQAALAGPNLILENLPDMVWLKDTQGVYLACVSHQPIVDSCKWADRDGAKARSAANSPGDSLYPVPIRPRLHRGSHACTSRSVDHRPGPGFPSGLGVQTRLARAITLDAGSMRARCEQRCWNCRLCRLALQVDQQQ